MTRELKDCPFCGCKATFVKHSAGMPGTMGYDRWDAVACKHCRATVGACDRRFREKDDAAAAWNRRAPDARDARIAELEAELVAEAKKTASEKLRADQMTEQHRMQAKMHSQAREELAALKSPAPIPPNSTELEPATPWYPDDSGEWVEVPDSQIGRPSVLREETLIEVVTREERSGRYWRSRPDTAARWPWTGYRGGVVAYKVVKP